MTTTENYFNQQQAKKNRFFDKISLCSLFLPCILLTFKKLSQCLYNGKEVLLLSYPYISVIAVICFQHLRRHAILQSNRHAILPPGNTLHPKKVLYPIGTLRSRQLQDYNPTSFRRLSFLCLREAEEREPGNEVDDKSVTSPEPSLPLVRLQYDSDPEALE